jgi:hypothetical protein
MQFTSSFSEKIFLRRNPKSGPPARAVAVALLEFAVHVLLAVSDDQALALLNLLFSTKRAFPLVVTGDVFERFFACPRRLA